MRASWEGGAGKAFSLVFKTGVICAQLCPPPHPQMFLVCGFLTSPEAALGWLVAGSALAPQLGFGRTKDKKQGQLLETSENWASTSWSQVWVGKEKLDGGRGQDSCFPCQSTKCSFHPTDGPRNHVIKYNIQYGTDRSSPGSSLPRDQMLTECNQDTSLKREAGWKW